MGPVRTDDIPIPTMGGPILDKLYPHFNNPQGVKRSSSRVPPSASRVPGWVPVMVGVGVAAAFAAAVVDAVRSDPKARTTKFVHIGITGVVVILAGFFVAKAYRLR